MFEEHQDIKAVAQGGVDVEEINGDEGVGLEGQELSPGWAAAAGCWVDAGPLEDVPDGGGADAVAEPGQFAVDSPVAPSRVFLGQLQDELLDRGLGRGASGRSATGGVVPFGGDESAVGGLECGGCDREGGVPAPSRYPRGQRGEPEPVGRFVAYRVPGR
jgi:hypothetical protein